MEVRVHVARSVVAVGVTALLAGLFGCERRETAPETSTAKEPVAKEPAARGGGPQAPTQSDVVSLVAAIDRLAEADCDRARACGDIGESGRYDTRDACLRETSEADADDLGLDRCPQLDAAQLEACLKAVREAPCDHEGSHFARLDACRVAVLCRR